ncbi:ABC transporter substrate-binding protein [Cryobacterium sp. 10C3]|uniref:ABC transporter substrate-binding protein n=1 Tax=Cryobacterium sp. 10C3 TaxID=3048577 RepID=UPI002AB544D1|nr:ABC transporter substrate-binding protein [Cryobacterium sp. 10C3]MDY7558061.1 ABC transporter substrate-binding protein [Cryobacterium sp. 10C3]
MQGRRPAQPAHLRHRLRGDHPGRRRFRGPRGSRTARRHPAQGAHDALPATTKTSALWYSSGVDSPYVGAGIGAPQMIMDAAGLTNVFASVKDTWTSVGWESVVAADPSVIVLVDATWNTAESKIKTLETNPATKNLTAVKNKRYITLPFASTEAGIRNVEAAATTIDQLADLNSLSK